ncbi:MAG: carboxypeptidase-like regulatory domain-containing protein, partial [Gloeobacteraceae cyanobacterium ES-bin-316]|nr:carboxypeptidase-like regulatory domain-containing protein [Ferruginibacter sp.]
MRNYLHKRQSKVNRLGLLLLILFCTIISHAQVKISGKITNEKGQAVTGVSVTVKNAGAGTSSNPDGTYQLVSNLKAGKQTILFSAIGYKNSEQTVTVETAGDYNLDAQLMADPLGLDEVIVTGTSAGTTKRQLGSYISTVNASQLNKGATGNVLAALQGKTAGAQITQNSGDPSGGISVRLRGISSISSSSEPLYIVDGV